MLPSHCTGLPAGHVQKPVDELQTLSPGQGSGEQVLPPVHIELTQVWLVPHGLLQPPQCWVLIGRVGLAAPVTVAVGSTGCAGNDTIPRGDARLLRGAVRRCPSAQGRHFFFFFLQRVAQHRCLPAALGSRCHAGGGAHIIGTHPAALGLRRGVPLSCLVVRHVLGV